MSTARRFVYAYLSCNTLVIGQATEWAFCHRGGTPRRTETNGPVNLRAFIALVVVQTAILLALAVRVFLLDGDVARPQDAEPAAVYVQPSSVSQPRRMTVIGDTDEDRLREIIREEFALALEELRAVAGSTDASPGQPLQSGPAYERRREAVAQRVDYYVSVGHITEQEMSRLHLDIAQLNPDDRRAMIGAIVRAMNHGQLDGQL